MSIESLERLGFLREQGNEVDSDVSAILKNRDGRETTVQGCVRGFLKRSAQLSSDNSLMQRLGVVADYGIDVNVHFYARIKEA